jgi:hypothetical protein
MKYNLNKKQAFNKWASKKNKPSFTGIKENNRRVVPVGYFKLRKNVDKMLIRLFGESLGDFDLNYLILYLLNKDISATFYTTSGYNLFMFFDGFADNSGYGKYWEVLTINYSKLAQKLLNIDSLNILKILPNKRCIVFVKITIEKRSIEINGNIYNRML